MPPDRYPERLDHRRDEPARAVHHRGGAGRVTVVPDGPPPNRTFDPLVLRGVALQRERTRVRLCEFVVSSRLPGGASGFRVTAEVHDPSSAGRTFSASPSSGCLRGSTRVPSARRSRRTSLRPLAMSFRVHPVSRLRRRRVGAARRVRAFAAGQRRASRGRARRHLRPRG